MTSQVAVIPDWLPPPVLNGSRQRHWASLRKEAEIGKTRAWAAARQAHWHFVPGKVRLYVTFTFNVKRFRDTDNLYARAKHLVDGLKGQFFTDDDADHLELVVHAEVLRGIKQTRLELLPLSGGPPATSVGEHTDATVEKS